MNDEEHEEPTVPTEAQIVFMRKQAASLAKSMAYAMAMVTCFVETGAITGDEFEEMLNLETGFLQGFTYEEIIKRAQTDLS